MFAMSDGLGENFAGGSDAVLQVAVTMQSGTIGSHNNTAVNA